ncbi:MAG: FG-GAP repeat domain-containing protein [Opitutaceae bacterium]
MADVDRDGDPDVIAGPYWYAGPEFTKKHEIRAPHAYDPESCSDAFIMDTHDVDRDGWTDVLQVGWPGREALWYKNPGQAGGDGEPELVFATAKKLGWAAPDRDNTDEPRRFHPITPEGEWQRYTHALVLADIDGDGLQDIVTGKHFWAHGSKGDPEPNAPAVLYWFRLVRNEGEAHYEPHLIDDASGVGTQFVVTDVNGDNALDVVTSNKRGVFVFRQQRAPQMER